MRAPVLHADAPHPNAGKLFIDFMLSKEGQKILNSLDRHPVRMDIKVDPELEKIRRNLFPIKPAPAEVTEAYMKEFIKIFSMR
jgi:iron(III) transport system substrate-binding protein